MGRALWIAFVLSFGPAVSNAFARFAYALVLPAMRSDLQLGYAQAGWLNTANAIGYLAGAVLTRVLVARTGNRALFNAGMVITGLAVLATGLSSDPVVLTTMRLLAGFGGASVFICGGALSANVAPHRPEWATTTITVYFAGGGIGLILCGVAVPWLLAARGEQAWPLAWIGMGAVALAMAIASAWAVARIEEPGTAGVAPGAGAGMGAGAGTGAGTAPAPAARQGPRLWPAAIAYVGFGLGYIGYMTFVIAWMRDHGAGVLDVVLVWTLLGITTILAPLVWRIPFARWRGGRALSAVMGVLGVAAGLPLLDASLPTMLLSGALFGLAMFSVPSAIQSLVKHALPKARWGPVMASFTVLFALGQVVGPVGTGWLADLLGSLAPGLTASVVVLLAGSVIALLQADVHASQNEGTAR